MPRYRDDGITLEDAECADILTELESLAPMPTHRDAWAEDLSEQRRYVHKALPMPNPLPRLEKSIRVIFHAPQCPRLDAKPGRCTCAPVTILGGTRKP